jgi:hypothetical protein
MAVHCSRCRARQGVIFFLDREVEAPDLRVTSTSTGIARQRDGVARTIR